MKLIVRVAAAIVLGLNPALASAQALPPPRIVVPDVPAALEVPAGHDVFLKGHALGTQNYICLPTTTGVAWRFVGPQATLYQTHKGDPRQQLTTHFLSADTSAARVARPTWQDSADSSRVWGRVVASSSDAAYVEAGAIAWLLLEAAHTDRGPFGGSALAETTFIHRVNTSGGIAPSTGCSDAAQVGTLALVPYTTDYFFYRASNRQ